MLYIKDIDSELDRDDHMISTPLQLMRLLVDLAMFMFALLILCQRITQTLIVVSVYAKGFICRDAEYMFGWSVEEISQETIN